MKALEEEAEFRRAQERLTMKHRNSSKWAKHALRRGAHLLDTSTKSAVNEQLRLGQELKQKVGHLTGYLSGYDIAVLGACTTRERGIQRLCLDPDKVSGFGAQAEGGASYEPPHYEIMKYLNMRFAGRLVLLPFLVVLLLCADLRACMTEEQEKELGSWLDRIEASVEGAQADGAGSDDQPDALLWCCSCCVGCLHDKTAGKDT